MIPACYKIRLTPAESGCQRFLGGIGLTYYPILIIAGVSSEGWGKRWSPGSPGGLGGRLAWDLKQGVPGAGSGGEPGRGGSGSGLVARIGGQVFPVSGLNSEAVAALVFGDASVSWDPSEIDIVGGAGLEHSFP